MKTIILDRNDIRTELHPFMFDEICEELGIDPKSTDIIELTVADAKPVD